MPRYRVLEKSFINNRIEEVGAIIDYEGEASSNLELVKPKTPLAAGDPNAAPLNDGGVLPSNSVAGIQGSATQTSEGAGSELVDPNAPLV